MDDRPSGFQTSSARRSRAGVSGGIALAVVVLVVAVVVFFELRISDDGPPPEPAPTAVQTARGHSFRSLYPGRSEDFSIGLPGSIDWYDRIVVEVME
jgi:hypothetical protein